MGIPLPGIRLGHGSEHSVGRCLERGKKDTAGRTEAHEKLAGRLGEIYLAQERTGEALELFEEIGNHMGLLEKETPATAAKP